MTVESAKFHFVIWSIAGSSGSTGQLPLFELQTL
eukprot:COSAG02_NODE_49073_length_329_cov_0.891304_2_plen_33_part_01